MAVIFYSRFNMQLVNYYFGESSSVNDRFNFNIGIGHKLFYVRKFEAFASQNSETMY